MKDTLFTLCISLSLALGCNSSVSGQSEQEIDIGSYRSFITNLEENIRSTPDISLSRGKIRKVMGLRSEILNLLADATDFQLISGEQLALLQSLNREMIAIIWGKEPSLMVQLFDSEREINYIFNIRNPLQHRSMIP